MGYWLKAGRQSTARSATTEAVSQLRKGLDLLLSLPEDPCRTQQELDLQIALSQALIATSGYSAPAVAETIVRARALAKQLDRSDYVLPLLGSQWNFHLARAEHKLALSLAKEMEEFGKARGDETARLLGNFSDGLSCFFLGEITAAHARFEQSLGLSDPAHRALNVAGQYAGTLVHLATTLAILGYVDQARSRVEEAVSESRRLGHALTRVDVLFWASWTEWVSGSVHALQRHAEEAIALSNEHGFPFWLGWAPVCRGWSLSALGQGEEGLPLVTRGLSLARDTGGVVHTPWALTLLAEAEAKLGNPVKGLGYAADAAQIWRKPTSGSARPSCIVSVASCSLRQAIKRPRSKAMKRRSPSRNARAREYSSCVPRRALRASGATRANAVRPAICWRRSTIGSLKVSTRRFCKARRRCSSRCGDELSGPKPPGGSLLQDAEHLSGTPSALLNRSRGLEAMTSSYSRAQGR